MYHLNDGDDAATEMYQDAYEMQNLCILQAAIIAACSAMIAALEAENTQYQRRFNK